ncbi:MAG: KH domain-containing protein [Breznakia sp.]
MNYEKLILDLITPIVDDKDGLSAKIMSTLDENEILLHVYANSEDVARLIGRRGMMASSIRQLMSIASRQDGKMITIKFESY